MTATPSPWRRSTPTPWRGCAGAGRPPGARASSAGTEARAIRSTNTSPRRTRASACGASAPPSGSSATRTSRPPGARPPTVAATGGGARAAWRARPDGGADRRAVVPGEQLELAGGTWLLNPGAVGAPFPARGDFWTAMGAHARAGAWWLELDVDGLVATWRRAPFDPAGVTERARAAYALR